MTSWEAFSDTTSAIGAPGATPVAADPADQFPESGWGAVLCWACGPDRVSRTQQRFADTDPVRVETMTDGQTSRSIRRRTEDEQREIDDAIDDYLASAGVPPRPRGFTWTLTPTPGTGEPLTLRWLHDATQDALTAAGSSSEPPEVLRAARTVLTQRSP